MPATTQPRPITRSNDTTQAAKLLTAAELDLLTVLSAVKTAIGNIPKTTELAENTAAEKLLHEVLSPLMLASCEALQRLDQVRAAVLNR